MNEKVVLYERKGEVAWITLNRPQRRNAISLEMPAALREALKQASGEPRVRAVLLRGEGKSFCAGADLEIFSSISDPEQVERYLLGEYGPLILGLRELEKPVLCAVQGMAAGAGVSLALACDFRMLGRGAALALSFSNIGLVPDAGATWLLTRLVGYSRALQMACLGEPVPAEECGRMGLANWVVPDEELLEAAAEKAARLAARPTLAVGMTKRAMGRALQGSLREAIRREAALQKRAVQSRDHREGVRAFWEKRRPRFEGC